MSAILADPSPAGSAPADGDGDDYRDADPEVTRDRPGTRMDAMDDLDRLRELAAILPLLEAPGAEFGSWELPPPRDGVGSLGYYVLGPVGEAFRSAVARGGWIVAPFDWPAWLATPEGRTFRDDPAAVASASIDDLAHLLTAIIRSDRFSEGSLEGAYASGHLVAIARRAQALLSSANR